MTTTFLQSKPAKLQQVEDEEYGGRLGNMVDEILEEVLVRLPVKSLLRLKATCKTWRSLIESPSFVDFHSGRHRLDYHNRLVFSRFDDPKSHSMFSCAPSESDDDNLELITHPLYEFTWNHPIRLAEWPLDFSMYDPYGDDEEDARSVLLSPYFFMLGPLNNGVHCMIEWDNQRRNRVSVPSSRITLCNLATRDFKAINPNFNPESSALLSSLAHRPSSVHYGFGLIRDEAGTVVDYKVVVIVLTGPDYSRFVSFVHSLRRGSWNMIADVTRTRCSGSNQAVVGLVNGEGDIEIPDLVQHDIVGCRQSFLHGSWHWLEYEHDRVLRFDLAKEEFSYLEGPPHDCYDDIIDEDGWMRGGLLLLDDRLTTIYVPYSRNAEAKMQAQRFEVWVMMKYGVKESWTKIYSCKTAFNRLFEYVIGLCYTTAESSSTEEDDDALHGAKIHIQRVFLDDFHTGQWFSWNGNDASRITEHSFQLQGSDPLWNILGVSTYVETLESLTLPHN